MRKVMMQAVLAVSVTLLSANAVSGAGATGAAGGAGTSGPGPAAGGAGAGGPAAAPGAGGPNVTPLPSSTGPSTAITPEAGSADPEINDASGATQMPRPGEPNRATRERRTPGVPPPVLPDIGENGSANR